jgi:hypothetical protein
LAFNFNIAALSKSVPTNTITPEPTLTLTITPTLTPTITPTPTLSLTPTPILFLEDPRKYLPIEAEMPKGFELSTSNIQSFSHELLKGEDAKTYTVRFTHDENLRKYNDEPSLVIYWGFVLPEEFIARKAFELISVPDAFDQIFFAGVKEDSANSLSDFKILNQRLEYTDEKLVYGRTLTSIFGTGMKTYIACYRVKNFVGITFTAIPFYYETDQEYNSSHLLYFVSLSIDKLK